MGWINGLFSFIFFIILIASIAYLMVRSRHDRDGGITAHDVFVAYFYFVMAISVVFMVSGLIYLLKIALSQAFEGGAIAGDLVLAFVLLGIGITTYLLHVSLKRRVEKRNDKTTPILSRVYFFSMLGSFGLAVLISLPLAIHQSIRYYTEDQAYAYYPGSFRHYTISDPSEELAVAIVLIPIWVYLMFKVLREIKQRDTGESEN
ncbi:DUF5671 domain-containing protein [Chloroflexota bacterium]